MSAERIAVLGAGPMGLAVAYQLARDGHQPVVFEAGDRVGGMTATFDFGGMEIERFYHFHCTSDMAFFEVLQELGIAHQLRWVETRMGYYHRGRLQPWGSPFALLAFSGLGPVSKLRYGVHAFLCTRRNDWAALDGIEATSWLRRWCGDQAFDVLWRPLFDMKFYEYASRISAAWIGARVRRIGRSRYNLFREKLGYLEGGSATLLAAMRAAIEERGGAIRLSSPVSRIELRDGKVAGILQGEERLPFGKVVSTIPVPYVPGILPDLGDEWLARYRALNNIAVVCVVAKLRRSVSPNFWVNVNDPEMDIPGFVEYSRLRPLGDTIVYVPFYMPASNPKFAESDAVFIGKVRRYLCRVNPSLSDTDFVELRTSRYRFAQPICEPGHLGRVPPIAVPVEGLWVADTSYYYPEDRSISESIALGRRLARMALA